MFIKSLKLTLLLHSLLYILSYCSPYIPSPSDCSNYYSSDNLPQACQQQNQTCIFMNGIEYLKNNSSPQTIFKICIYLPSYDIQISNNESLYEEIDSVFVYGKNFRISGGYYMNAESGVYIWMDQSIDMTSSGIISYKIWMTADQILLSNCSLANDSLLQTNCNCINQTGQCTPWTFRFPSLFSGKTTPVFNISNLSAQLSYLSLHSNAILLEGLTSLTITSSTLRISIIGLFSGSINIISTNIDTSTLGYPSSTGLGCGYYDQVLHQLLNCMGTGGSHGGFGGNSSPQNCYLLMSKPPYGSIEFPYAPGSGGGFFIPSSKQSSSGGGVINIQGQKLRISNSNITSEGKNGTQGGGGGAGGAISLDYMYLEVVSSVISVKGGNGQKSSSGSGGRVRIFNYNWITQVQTNNTANLRVNISGGPLCPVKLSCGENGSVFTSPCRPGFQLNSSSYICQPCRPGQYQMTYGYSMCINCSQNPQYSSYSQNNSNPLDYAQACKFYCNGDLINYNNQSCLTYSATVFRNIGGQNTLICIILIVGSIIIYFLTIVFKKLSENQSFSNAENQLANKLLEKSYFRMEDIPFHELRLYIDGNNDPFHPWRIDEAVQSNFFAQIKNPITKINHTLSKAIKEINRIGSYSRYEKIILVVFKYTYYPLSKLILGVMRRNRAKAIFNSINSLNKKIPDFENLQIKFNIKPQLTVCSLEIFNYTKSVLDFYIENYYPLFFMLEKAPFGGYSIDFSDPFIKVLINEISERDSSEGKNLQVFFLELNKLLKTPQQFFPLLSYLWSIKNLFPHLQAYFWQPPNKILGVDKDYEIDMGQPLFLVISSENINNRHFIFSENLPCIYFSEIQCLKHKFTIRKQISIEDEKINIWIIRNQFQVKKVSIALGLFSVIAFLLSVATFFMIIILARKFNVGVILYFILWPLSDFAVVVFNFRTLMIKCEGSLASAIQFNITTLIKTFIMFVISLITSLALGMADQVNIIMVIWLIQFLVNSFVLIIQLLLRAHIV